MSEYYHYELGFSVEYNFHFIVKNLKFLISVISKHFLDMSETLLGEGASVDPLFFEDGPEVFCQVAQHKVVGKPDVAVLSPTGAGIGR